MGRYYDVLKEAAGDPASLDGRDDAKQLHPPVEHSGETAATPPGPPPSIPPCAPAISNGTAPPL